MPLQIGAKPHTFSDPTGLLSDCHRRIEMFMRSLEGVAQLMDKLADDETRRALTTALNYFREAAPKHTADEEESLFPRLRALNSPEVERAFSHLELLENDHRWAEPLHAQLESLGRKYLDSRELSQPQIEEFRLLVSRLFVMYKRHIAVEDGDLFPAAAKALSDADKQVIAEEMAKRRAAPLVDFGGGPDADGL
jgi:hemerythrin-like domain-containing protein